MNLNNSDFFEIYDNFNFSFFNKNLILIVFCYLILFFILFFIIYKFFFYSDKKKSYKELCLNELNDLSLSVEKDANCNYKEVYFKLTKIFKLILFHKFNIYLFNKTEIEIIKEIESFSTTINKEKLLQIKDFFEFAFEVKFKAQKVDNKKLQKDIKFIKLFIDNTFKELNSKKLNFLIF